ncbi:MAG: cytochrome c biogenesis protein ResB [Deltaproteobacteria bacterium]|nr:MAG: cytochrome c biogenesis protein ResB [Deltaproteobacteria bacterium]
MFFDPSIPISFDNSSPLNPLNDIFELDDIFHSWWFTLIILLLALNLIACSIIRFPKIWNDSMIPYKRLDSFILRKSSEYANGYLKQIKMPLFNSAEYKWKDNNAEYIFFEKHKFARFGVYIIHFSLLVIMLGSILTSQFGFEGIMFIPEGKSSNMIQIQGPNKSSFLHHLNFQVRCNHFHLNTYLSGDINSYESNLSILKNKKDHSPILSKTIKLNDPLYYYGYTFYQESFKPLKKKKHVFFLKVNNELYVTSLKETFHYKCPVNKLKDKSIKIVKYFKDYYSLGEAIQIKTQDDIFIILKNAPNNYSHDLIKFIKADYQYATGIKVCKTPGITLVFLGFAIMLLGLMIAFRMNQRRYYAKIIKITEKKYYLSLAGTCNRFPQAFKKEFNSIVFKHLFI